MNQTPKPSAIVLMASGAVTFLFSFFAFFKYSLGGFGSKSFNAWSGDAGTLFMATWPALIGLAIAALVAARTFADVSLPERVITFTWPQIFLVLSFAGALIMIGYLLGGGAPDGAGKGFGFFLMLLGSLGLVAGSVMELLEIGDTGSTGGGAAPPQGPSSF